MINKIYFILVRADAMSNNFYKMTLAGLGVGVVSAGIAGYIKAQKDEEVVEESTEMNVHEAEWMAISAMILGGFLVLVSGIYLAQAYKKHPKDSDHDDTPSYNDGDPIHEEIELDGSGSSPNT